MTLSAVQVYYNNCLNLAKTLCIKSEDSANAINNYLIAMYGMTAVDLTNQTSWKYYLNISGQYHPRDTVMYVTSLDSQQQIVFNLSNLAANPATKAAYVYGTRYYYSLLAQYPEQEQLILGIIYPADINLAISANDWTILSYDKTLVDAQEVTLIPQLQTWINNYLVRWNVSAFINSDNLYQVSYLAVFYLNMYLKILNIRLSNCKTPFAHSFHIQQFLASHQGLDKYIQYMTQEQIMYLYRNILYIERHPGWSQTLQQLIDVLLTPRNIPIAKYYMRLKSQFNNYKPTISFDREIINTLYDTGDVNNFSYTEFLAKTVSLAPGNQNIFNSQNNQIQEKIQNSSSDSMLTKNLESSMYDYTDAVPHTMTQIFLNQWLYLSMNGYYNAVVSFTDPISLNTYSLSTIDAFTYMSYLFIKTTGLTPTIIPEYIGTKILKIQAPTLSEMTAFADSTYKDASALASFLLSFRPTQFTCSTISSFFSLCTNIFELGLQEWYQISGNGDMYHRAELQTMAGYQYFDQMIAGPYTGQNPVTWVASKQLPDPAGDSLEIQELIQAVYQAGTGLASVNQTSYSQIQTAMIDILSLLSSYSIQIISQINNSPIQLLNWSAIRAGNLQTDSSSTTFTNTGVEVTNSSASSNSVIDYTENTLPLQSGVKDITTNNYAVTIDYYSTATLAYTDNFIVALPHFFIADAAMNTTAFSNYSSLTSVQANSLPDIYQNAVR